MFHLQRVLPPHERTLSHTSLPQRIISIEHLPVRRVLPRHERKPRRRVRVEQRPQRVYKTVKAGSRGASRRTVEPLIVFFAR